MRHMKRKSRRICAPMRRNEATDEKSSEFGMLRTVLGAAHSSASYRTEPVSQVFCSGARSPARSSPGYQAGHEYYRVAAVDQAKPFRPHAHGEGQSRARRFTLIM